MKVNPPISFRTMRKLISPLVLGLFVISGCTEQALSPSVGDEPTADALAKREGGQFDGDVAAKFEEINANLATRGLNIQVSEIHFFTRGEGRPSVRILQQPRNWVAGDERRLADGDNLTYIVDQSNGATSSGLTNAETEAAIDAAMTTWNDAKPMRKVDLIKRTDPGTDITVYDWFYGFGGFGDFTAADIVNAGWWPAEFFDAVAGGGPGSGANILAFSVTFTWIPPDDDINNDHYLDTALNEVYYNDGFAWGIGVDRPGIDVETVALHENGHSVALGHFGPEPDAVMNPVYGGIRTSPYPTDLAGISTVFNNWPN